MRAARLAPACACLLALALGAAACGSGDSAGVVLKPVPSSPAPPKSSFPQPDGRTLKELIQDADSHSELILTPAASVFHAGKNRYPFGIAERHGRQIDDAEVALYYSRVPKPKPGAKSSPGTKIPAPKAEGEALEQPAVGPFPARIESLGTKPAFVSQETAERPDTPRVVYVSEIPFPHDGQWRMAAVIREDGETFGSLLPSAEVDEHTPVPQPGEPAPRIHTPTAEEVGGDLAKITTRVPPDTQNAVDYADALGKEPILLLFATPRFCQSQACGPVVDVAEQAKREFGDKAAFIHMEIFNDNDPERLVRPQVRAFHLPTEPWLFAINREGVVSSAVEGPFGLELMDEVAEKVIAE